MKKISDREFRNLKIRKDEKFKIGKMSLKIKKSMDVLSNQIFQSHKVCKMELTELWTSF